MANHQPVDPKSPYLVTKIRGQHHRRVLEEKLHVEQEEQKKMAEFHARPIMEPEQPFVPKRSDKPTTENVPHQLNTEIRKENRKKFEDEMHEKDEMMERFKLQKMKEEEVGDCSMNAL